MADLDHFYFHPAMAAGAAAFYPVSYSPGVLSAWSAVGADKDYKTVHRIAGLKIYHVRKTRLDAKTGKCRRCKRY